MKIMYYISGNLVHFFSTSDGIRLIPEIVTESSRIEEGRNLLRKAYNNDDLYFERITTSLDVPDDLITLEDLNDIINRPNERNYNKFDNKMTIGAYTFLKSLKKEEAPIQNNQSSSQTVM